MPISKEGRFIHRIVRSPFLDGIGSIMDIGGTQSRQRLRNMRVYYAKQDWWTDWENVGGGMERAMESYKRASGLS